METIQIYLLICDFVDNLKYVQMVVESEMKMREISQRSCLLRKILQQANQGGKLEERSFTRYIVMSKLESSETLDNVARSDNSNR